LSRSKRPKAAIRDPNTHTEPQSRNCGSPFEPRGGRLYSTSPRTSRKSGDNRTSADFNRVSGRYWLVRSPYPKTPASARARVKRSRSSKLSASPRSVGSICARSSASATTSPSVSAFRLARSILRRLP